MPVSEKIVDAVLQLLDELKDWRKQEPIGKETTRPCPVCTGTVRIVQVAAKRGPLRAQCSTQNCVQWVE